MRCANSAGVNGVRKNGVQPSAITGADFLRPTIKEHPRCNNSQQFLELHEKFTSIAKKILSHPSVLNFLLTSERSPIIDFPENKFHQRALETAFRSGTDFTLGPSEYRELQKRIAEQIWPDVEKVVNQSKRTFFSKIQEWSEQCYSSFAALIDPFKALGTHADRQTFSLAKLILPEADLEQLDLLSPRHVAKWEKKHFISAHEARKFHQELGREVSDWVQQRNRLANSNIGLCLKQLRPYRSRSQDLQDDLLQEALMGVSEAVERFDPHRGTEFATYAGDRIKQKIQRWFSDKNEVIRVPAKRQAHLNQIERANIIPGGRATNEELSRHCNLALEDVAIVRQVPRRFHPNHSDKNGESILADLGHFMADHRTPDLLTEREIEQKNSKASLYQVIHSLLEPKLQLIYCLNQGLELSQSAVESFLEEDARGDSTKRKRTKQEKPVPKEFFAEYKGEEVSLQDIGEKVLGVSRERVRQLFRAAEQIVRPLLVVRGMPLNTRNDTIWRTFSRHEENVFHSLLSHVTFDSDIILHDAQVPQEFLFSCTAGTTFAQEFPGFCQELYCGVLHDSFLQQGMDDPAFVGRVEAILGELPSDQQAVFRALQLDRETRKISDEYLRILRSDEFVIGARSYTFETYVPALYRQVCISLIRDLVPHNTVLSEMGIKTIPGRKKTLRP